MYQSISSFFKNCVVFVTAFCIVLTVAGSSFTRSAQADVIYHAFDECFNNIKDKVPQIKAAGYNYIQVSPPNKTASRLDEACTSDKYWYMQYQPLDYVLEGNLGTREDLKDLINTAHENGIRVIADVVLNHLANYKNVPNKDGKPFPEAYPIFQNQEYFHNQVCINNYNNPSEVENNWLCSKDDPEGLPDLKTDLLYVQQQQQNYLKKLLDFGFDGLRFDAAKHISRDDMTKILANVPDDVLYYGEVIGNTYEDSMSYVPVFPKVTDFQLVNTLKNAFGFGGDLRSLVNPSDTRRALIGEHAVTFARNHDTWAEGQFDNWKFDQGDLPLATAYVLAIKEGTPLILNFDAFNPTVVAGTQFNQKMKGQDQYYRNGSEIAPSADSANLLFIERGGKGLAIINKAGTTFDVQAAKMPGLEVGCYNELQYNFKMCVDKGDDGKKYITQWGGPQRGGINIGNRTALFFVKAEV
ncbi:MULTISPECIES: alpha-amylase family glycosyl hydrolase [Cylindrospermopsis]|uniref:Alpha-amylase n=1 Tax=Cylindrospermopsis curvispora GIHE-G1 TaxID=2666332 RepID=A0A7H0EWY2_9CYAN|nr:MULTISPECIES: alpha-amylase family glycosyl hydrolase [Cylindrospermopsis]MBU6344976.1 alpha-amylase [Cyanobacteria bacterium REEB494]QNP28298.1 alpha-amylase [Cylindrospermopsis curvispora GIHE-G1]